MAVELIGNDNARISCLRWEKVTLGLKKTVLPLCQQLQYYLAQSFRRGPRSTLMSRPCGLLYHLDPQNSFFDLPPNSCKLKCNSRSMDIYRSKWHVTAHFINYIDKMSGRKRLVDWSSSDCDSSSSCADTSSSSSCKRLKRIRQISVATFNKCKVQYDSEHQTLTWLNCDQNKGEVTKLLCSVWWEYRAESMAWRTSLKHGLLVLKTSGIVMYWIMPILYGIIEWWYCLHLIDNPWGSQRTPGKRGSVCGNTSTDGILLQPISCPKKDGGEASHQFKGLNQFVRTQHFKMEGIHTLKETVRPNDWMVKVDLKDGFFTVPIHNSHKQYLRFWFQGLNYQFNCLPFHLLSAL